MYTVAWITLSTDCNESSTPDAFNFWNQHTHTQYVRAPWPLPRGRIHSCTTTYLAERLRWKRRLLAVRCIHKRQRSQHKICQHRGCVVTLVDRVHRRCEPCTQHSHTRQTKAPAQAHARHATQQRQKPSSCGQAVLAAMGIIPPHPPHTPHAMHATHAPRGADNRYSSMVPVRRDAQLPYRWPHPAANKHRLGR